MKNWIWIVLAMLVIGGSAYWWTQQTPASQNLPVQQVQTSQSNQQNTISGSQTYLNPQYGFSVQYPNIVQVNTAPAYSKTDWWYPFKNGKNLFSATYNGDLILFAVSSDSADLVDCPVKGKSQIINGIDFSYVWGTQGNGTDGPRESLYQMKRNGVCYAISIVQSSYQNDSWITLFSIAKSLTFK